jgi:hypothetical protein
MTQDQSGGEIDPNDWCFARQGEVGPLPNPFGHTFPLLTHDVEGRWRLVGTGFYISDGGVFVTARHVIDDVLKDGRQAAPLVILHLRSSTGFFGAPEFLLRGIAQCWLGDPADVALGVAATLINNVTGERLTNWAWTVSWSVPPNGARASTYAFPSHITDGANILFRPDAYGGCIQEAGDFRDRVRVPYPYLQVDFRIHGGASGGPILSCAEWPANIDHPPGPGFGAQSRCLGDAFLDAVLFSGEAEPRRATFEDLARAGAINVVDYRPKDRDHALNGIVVRLDMPIAAPSPKIKTAIWA